MATYNDINFGKSSAEVTENYKFALMGEDYQTSPLIYRANLERISILVDAIIQNSTIALPSGNINKINKVQAGLTKGGYNSISEEGSSRGLYLIKGS